MDKKWIKSWWNGQTSWNGEPVTYATSDEPSPKACFQVLVFFVIPWCIFLILLKHFL